MTGGKSDVRASRENIPESSVSDVGRRDIVRGNGRETGAAPRKLHRGQGIRVLWDVPHSKSIVGHPMSRINCGTSH